MLKISENNGTEEIGLVTPTPGVVIVLAVVVMGVVVVGLALVVVVVVVVVMAEAVAVAAAIAMTVPVTVREITKGSSTFYATNISSNIVWFNYNIQSKWNQIIHESTIIIMI